MTLTVGNRRAEWPTLRELKRCFCCPSSRLTLTPARRIVRIVVTGGAGFLGSHLCDALIQREDSVICVDNLSTGRLSNIEHLIGRPGFEFVNADVSEKIPVTGQVDAVAHLASPASPPDYHRMPLET